MSDRQTEIERRRLDRLRTARPHFGSISLVNTETVLRRQAGTHLIPTKSKMREIYAKISSFDDGLPNSIMSTRLLDSSLWQ